MKYVSLDTVFSSLARDLKEYSVSDGEVIEWCGRALEATQTESVYEHAIAFCEVKDHQCLVPKHLHVILQIARNNKWFNTGLTPSDVIADIRTVDSVDIPVALDAEGTPIHEYELAYYRPYFDILSDYVINGSNQPNWEHFTPVRLANSTFFDTVVAKEIDFENIYISCRDEYTIVSEDTLRFSFKEGQVAVSYIRQKMDCDTGFPMIPDSYANKQAIECFVRYKLKEIDFYQNRQGSESRLQKAESDWQWYCKQAVNDNVMPQTIDEWENLMSQRSYIMPETNRYNGFFGKLAYDENRNLMHYGRK